MRLRGGLTGRSAVGAFGVYVLASLLLFGLPVLGDPTHKCLCVASTTDEGVISWALEWWPHALLHGLNPFHAGIIYAPQGFDIAQGASMPGLAFALAPLTALAGPLFSFNMAALLAPALAAFFAFLLCRRLSRAFWPALFGGWLFGFSTYMLGQETGHLNLTLVFLVPAIVHLAVRAAASELSRRRFAVLLALALVAQFSLSVEVFVTFTLFAAITVLVAWIAGGDSARQALRALVGPAGVAYLATAVIASPYLYYALKPGGLPVLSWRTNKFSNDLLGFIVPADITRLGGARFFSTTQKFTAGDVEGAAYMGLPLLLMVLLSARAGWRRLEVRLLVYVLLIAAVCSLGGVLHVNGTKSIPFVWAAVNHLPMLGQIMPARLMLYGTLATALLSAIWLSGRGVAAYGLALAAVASLWPAVNLPFWHSRPDLPSFFTSSAYRHALRPRDTVLVLPVGINGLSMLWQAETHLGFQMASGYIVPPEAEDPYKHTAIYPTLTYNTRVPHEIPAAASFIASHHITVAVLSAQAAGSSPWPGILAQLGWGGAPDHGVLVLRPEGLVPEPPQPFPPPPRPVPHGPAYAQRAARRVAAQYLIAFAAGDAAKLCSLLTQPALASQIRRRDATQAQCAQALQPLMAKAQALRHAARRAHVGPATILGSYGYVAQHLPGQPSIYLPVRQVGGRWLVNGVAVPATR